MLENDNQITGYQLGLTSINSKNASCIKWIPVIALHLYQTNQQVHSCI